MKGNAAFTKQCCKCRPCSGRKDVTVRNVDIGYNCIFYVAGEWNGITIPGPYPVNRVGNAKKVYYRFTCQAIDEGG